MALDITGESPEVVAYRLFADIAGVENKSLNHSSGSDTPDRKWILDTFAECLKTVRNPTGHLAN